MATSPEAIAQAKAYYRAGRWQDAEQIYRQILRADPANAEGYYLLGAAWSVCSPEGGLQDRLAGTRPVRG